MKLPKSARLHHRSLQESLFREGKPIFTTRLKMVWRAIDEETLAKGFRDRIPPLIGPVQLLVSVPKKRRRKAVDRVLMRRRIREAYRASAASLISKVDDIEGIRTVSVALIYCKDFNAPYKDVLEDVRKLIEKLTNKLESKYKKDNTEIQRDSDLDDGLAD